MKALVIALAAASVLCAQASFEKWLQDDVSYIIKDEERREARQLTTEDQRQNFIAGFWLKRGPEARGEHYRRIIYANERFVGPVPGWKSDRGRAYVVFGPPQEIESHPKGGGGDFPREAWRYSEISGIGSNVTIEFIDATMTGEYRLTLDPGEKKALATPEEQLKRERVWQRLGLGSGRL